MTTEDKLMLLYLCVVELKERRIHAQDQAGFETGENSHMKPAEGNPLAIIKKEEVA